MHKKLRSVELMETIQENPEDQPRWSYEVLPQEIHCRHCPPQVPRRTIHDLVARLRAKTLQLAGELKQRVFGRKKKSCIDREWILARLAEGQGVQLSRGV